MAKDLFYGEESRRKLLAGASHHDLLLFGTCEYSGEGRVHPKE